MTASRVIIENPILNAPFDEPDRHFRFTDEGITDEIIEGRRTSAYFVPIARPKMKGKQQQFLLPHDEWNLNRLQENAFINRVRGRVAIWRQGGYQGVTKTTARLLRHWQAPERERRLFFCQVEALETIIYITEVARKFGDGWMDEELRRENEAANPGLFRMACKMATGSGKTVVMAMLITWQALNKLADSRDGRFSDAFLIITPGITIRDRLRVLLPSEPANYYRALDILPVDLLEGLGQAKIVITNYHAFKPRELVGGAALNKKILRQGKGGASPFTETPDQMVRRVCRELGQKKNIIVLSDEAHHCYRRRPDEVKDEPKLTGEEKAEAKKRDEEARIWISGVEAVKAKIGVKAVYDLSATPFFLRGSGYPEGTLFPWVVSDFSLIDAIESGLVKVPRVPVADDAVTGETPTYRALWPHIREQLPKRGRGAAESGEPKLPMELQGALHSLYSNYERAYRTWEANADALLSGLTPPVFIVVCNNTSVSKMVYDYIAGWGKPLPDGSTIVVPGALPIFNNELDRTWAARPNTILVDSEQLESGEGMTADFKQIAAREIEEFKADYRRRYPGRDVSEITDEELLREVMNTVGKAGKLGEGVKCVVSVSMLTEGWDANTVTHILGVRAFGTQLLCEQVVGRALRRMSYAPNDEGKFDPEYADVYGVPFSFIPANGAVGTPRVTLMPTRVRALEERIDCEISFPRLVGYHYMLGDQPIEARFTQASKLAISTRDVPTQVQVDPIVGQGSIHTLDDLKGRRVQEIAFTIARRTLEQHFRDRDGNVKHWYFPQLLDIARRWLAECVIYKDGTFPQLLLLTEFTHDAADRIYEAIIRADEQEKSLAPILRPYDAIGSTRYVDFDTTRPVFITDAERCHISHVVADTNTWEQKMAQALEEMDEVQSYVKNQGLGFTIPYIFEGEERSYIPDFIARVDDGRPDRLHLIVEVSGEAKKDKAAKVSTAETFWIPAVNTHGGFGRWDFLQITDPWDAQNTIRARLRGEAAITRYSWLGD